MTDLQKVEIPTKYGSLEDFLKDSEEFEAQICKAPTIANWITTQNKDPDWLNMANQSYPILHEEVLQLCQKFLEYKQKYGNSKEKEFYVKMSLISLIERLISKRPLSFVGAYDRPSMPFWKSFSS